MTNDQVIEKHILVVEDDPDFAVLLRSVLVKSGYTVETAFDGATAIKQVHVVRPDLITLDIKMPSKSGLHFYRQLKADERFRDIPVVVVTGVTHNDREMETFIRCFLEKEGVPHPDAYVEKPIDEACLLRAIEKALSSRSSVNC